MSEFPEGYGDWTWGELEDFARGLMEKVAVLEGACRHGIAYDVHCPDCADGGRGFCACPECEGVSDEPRYVLNSDGWQPAPDVDQACSHCGGDGEIAKPGVPYSYAIICKTCAGTGRGPAGVPDEQPYNGPERRRGGLIHRRTAAPERRRGPGYDLPAGVPDVAATQQQGGNDEPDPGSAVDAEVQGNVRRDGSARRSPDLVGEVGAPVPDVAADMIGRVLQHIKVCEMPDDDPFVIDIKALAVLAAAAGEATEYAKHYSDMLDGLLAAAEARAVAAEAALKPVSDYLYDHYFVNDISDGDGQLVVMLWPAEIHAILAAAGRGEDA